MDCREGASGRKGSLGPSLPVQELRCPPSRLATLGGAPRQRIPRETPGTLPGSAEASSRAGPIQSLRLMSSPREFQVLVRLCCKRAPFL